MNNNKNLFCLKETKLNHVQATEGKCSKLPLPFLSNLALQALIIKVMHGASVIQFFILSPSHRHAGFYKPTLERYSPFLLLTSISSLSFLIIFVKFSILHWQKKGHSVNAHLEAFSLAYIYNDTIIFLCYLYINCFKATDWE